MIQKKKLYEASNIKEFADVLTKGGFGEIFLTIAARDDLNKDHDPKNVEMKKNGQNLRFFSNYRNSNTYKNEPVYLNIHHLHVSTLKQQQDSLLTSFDKRSADTPIVQHETNT